jgi:hypothetical protein
MHAMNKDARRAFFLCRKPWDSSLNPSLYKLKSLLLFALFLANSPTLEMEN